jgi:hypothetical protein
MHHFVRLRKPINFQIKNKNGLLFLLAGLDFCVLQITEKKNFAFLFFFHLFICFSIFLCRVLFF